MPPLVKRLLIVLVCLLWIPIGGELFLRVFDPIEITPRFIQEGSHGIRENIPGSRYHHVSREYYIPFAINEQGMRDHRTFKPRAESGTLRILLIGDSFGMGYGVSFKDSVPALLETKLAESLDSRVEVVNYSVSGFGTAEELITLDDRGWELEPDVVICYFHPGDLSDNVRSQLFRLDDGNLVRWKDQYLPAVKLRTALFSYSAYRLMAQYSQFYSWIRNRAGIYARAALASIRSQESKENDSKKSDGTETIGYPIQLTLQLLSQIKKQCVAHDAKFIVLSIPVCKGRAEFSERFPEAAAETLGLDIAPVSPIECFEQHPGEIIYWEHSAGHWSPLGTNCVAEVLAAKVRAVYTGPALEKTSGD